ncbi:MAG: hypothetical protein K0S39_2603 [Paenibacillus sp.]|jgi:hypothetical protein|nr:hypothetical protein [Paenibacillus sp.]
MTAQMKVSWYFHKQLLKPEQQDCPQKVTLSSDVNSGYFWGSPGYPKAKVVHNSDEQKKGTRFRIPSILRLPCAPEKSAEQTVS